MAPVLVARDLRSEGIARMLIAVDGSTASLHAIETVSSLFDLDGAEVCLMHIAETPWVQFGLDENWETYSEEAKESSEAGVMEKELVREGESCSRTGTQSASNPSMFPSRRAWRKGIRPTKS